MRRQETAAAAVADKAERVALFEVRERQRCEREEVAEWRYGYHHTERDIQFTHRVSIRKRGRRFLG